MNDIYESDYPDDGMLHILFRELGNTSLFHGLNWDPNSNGTVPVNLTRQYVLDWMRSHDMGLEFTGIDNPFPDFMLAEQLTPHPIIQVIQKIGVPIILFPGLVGNALSLLVYLWTHLKVQSSSIYLAFLNIVDIAFLLTLLPIWTSWIGYDDWMLHTAGWCQMNIFLNHCFALLSVWAVVCISAERYVVVFYPWLRHRLCSRRQTIYTVILMTILACIITSYPLWAMEIFVSNGKELCLPTTRVHRSVLQLFTSIYTLCTFAIPGMLIAFMNGRIGYHIAIIRDGSGTHRDSSNSADALMSEGYKSGMENLTLHEDNKISREFNCQSCNYVPSQTGEFSMEYVSMYSVRRNQRITAIAEQCKRNRERRRRYQLNATRSLIAITSIFFILNVPIFIVRVQSDITTMFYKQTKHLLAKQIWQEFALFLYYLNFSANFLMYVVVSRHFRQGLRRLFNRFRKKFHISNLIKNKS